MQAITRLLALAATHATLSNGQQGGSADAIQPPRGTAPQSGSNGNTQPQSGLAAQPPVLYTILSASIQQYSGSPQPDEQAEAAAAATFSTAVVAAQKSPLTQAQSPSPTAQSRTRRIRRIRRQVSDGQAGQALNADTAGFPLSNSSSDDPYTMDDSPYVPLPTTMENFTILIAPGNSAAAAAIPCNLTWDAGLANSGTRDHIASENFTCSDPTANVRMERRNVTFRYGFYVFVQIGSSPVATWQVKDLAHSPGWSFNSEGGGANFTGPAPLTQPANMTLADFLEVPKDESR